MTLSVAINGRFLSHHTSGVVRVQREFVSVLDSVIDQGKVCDRFRLICPENASLEGMRLNAINVEFVGAGLRGHAWEQLALPYYAGSDLLLCLGNTAPFYSLMSKRRVAVMIHDLSYRLYPHAYNWQYRFGHSLIAPALLKFSNPIITVSESEKQVICSVDKSVQDRVVVAQNGGWQSSDGSRRADRQTAPNTGYVLYVGSHSDRKNIHGIEATAVRMAREFGIRTKLVGSAGSIFRYEKPDLPSDVADFVEYCGHVEDQDKLAALYSGARLLLFPSFYEASPLPPVEAMHFGCPVVASDIPSMRERCGDAAQYCDPHSLQSIFEATQTIIMNSQRADELVRNGYKRQMLFTWESQVRTVLQALRAPDPANP